MSMPQQSKPPNPVQEENNRRAGGVVGGAILGGSIGGPPGAVIGAVVGLVLAQIVNDEKKKSGKK